MNYVLHHMDDVINKNIHFMLGQKYNSLDIHCYNDDGNNVNMYDDERIDSRTFFNIDDIMDDKVEIIYDITCSTNINIDGFGDLSFGKHLQWIDPDVIIKCELIKITNDDDDDQLKFQIDTTKSYSFVKNYD